MGTSCVAQNVLESGDNRPDRIKSPGQAWRPPLEATLDMRYVKATGKHCVNHRVTDRYEPQILLLERRHMAYLKSGLLQRDAKQREKLKASYDIEDRILSGERRNRDRELEEIALIQLWVRRTIRNLLQVLEVHTQP
jgi:hypothetical protein